MTIKSIAYISFSPIPSKAANSVHVMKMCSALSQNGRSVTLIAPRELHGIEPILGDVYEHYGVQPSFELCYLDSINGRLKQFHYAFNCWNKIRKLNPDLVYSRFTPGALLCAATGRKTVYEAHIPNWERSRLEHRFLKLLMKSSGCLGIVAISQAMKKIFALEGTVPVDEIFVAHDGADEVKQEKQDVAISGRPGALRVGYIGSLYRGRGLELILAIAKQLTDVDFHIVGGTADQVAQLNVASTSENVTFHGYVPPALTPNYRDSFDVLIAPYQDVIETAGGGNTAAYCSPLKIFEYMASGKAIICSNLPVIQEVLNVENSILADPNDLQKWIDGIRLLSDASLRRRLGQAAKRDFEQHFSWNKRADQILTHFEAKLMLEQGVHKK
jgi:glycosyltransferase involved in cell wall biosynthesis